MPYELSDKHTSADIGLIATGRDLVELFTDAALGMTSIMVDIKGLEETRQISVELKAESLSELFFAWLSELIYIKDAEKFLLKKCRFNLDESNTSPVLKAELFGDTIDGRRQILKTDVKAVTFYKYSIEKVGNVWRGEVVFDL